MPLGKRGVRFDWLADFIRLIDTGNSEAWGTYYRAQETRKWSSYAAEDAGGLSSFTPPVSSPLPYEPRVRDFVDKIIVPLTAASHAPFYALVPPEFRGEPTSFVSHAWDSNLCGQFGFLGAMLVPTGGSKLDFVWLDFACYNQHRIDQVAADMMSIISDIGHVTFAVTDNPFWDRLWCLWEMLCAHRSGARVELRDVIIHSPKYAAPRRDFTSTADALATRQDDRAALVDEILSTFGSIEEADNHIRALLGLPLVKTRGSETHRPD